MQPGRFRYHLPPHPVKSLPGCLQWLKQPRAVPAVQLVASEAIPAGLTRLVAVWLLQIILAAALKVLPQECQGFLDVNWPFFFLVLPFCTLAGLLLLH